jgi:hypothetical protein
MMDAAVRHQCVSVLRDVPLPAAASSGNDPTATAGLPPLLAVAGAWLDPGDPLLAALPADAVADLCGPGAAVAAAYFCSFVVLCGLVMVNFVIGGGLETGVHSTNMLGPL